jgi:hypothetical protein
MINPQARRLSGWLRRGGDCRRQVIAKAKRQRSQRISRPSQRRRTQEQDRWSAVWLVVLGTPKTCLPDLPGSAFDWPGRHQSSLRNTSRSNDCDNHNEAAEYAAKLEAGLLPSNINVLIFDHLVSAVEQRVWNGKSFRPRHICKPAFCARGNGN